MGQPSAQCLGVGDVLYGKVAPAGRMVQTLYPQSVQHQLSIFDMNMRPGVSPYPRPDCAKPFTNCTNGTNSGRTHRFYTGDAVVPFGFGLSYTTFAYSAARFVSSGAGNGGGVDGSNGSGGVVRLDAVDAMLGPYKNKPFPPQHEIDSLGTLVQHQITVTNTGNVDADDVVLGFMKPPGAGKNGVPLQSLYDFARVHVPAGKSVTVSLNATALDFTQVGLGGTRSVHPGEYTFQFGIPETSMLGQGFATETVLTAVGSV